MERIFVKEFQKRFVTFTLVWIVKYYVVKLRIKNFTITSYYNLEIVKLHNYCVSRSGFLVHNRRCPKGGKKPKKPKPGKNLLKGVSKKIILKGTDDTIDTSKFSGSGNRKTFKHWILEKDQSAGKSTSHRDSYWKLKNTHDKGFRRTLAQDGKILDD